MVNLYIIIFSTKPCCVQDEQRVPQIQTMLLDCYQNTDNESKKTVHGKLYSLSCVTVTDPPYWSEKVNKVPFTLATKCSISIQGNHWKPYYVFESRSFYGSPLQKFPKSYNDCDFHFNHFTTYWQKSILKCMNRTILRVFCLQNSRKMVDIPCHCTWVHICCMISMLVGASPAMNIWHLFKKPLLEMKDKSYHFLYPT